MPAVRSFGQRLPAVAVQALAGLTGGLLWLLLATPVWAHGPVPDEPPSIGSLLFGWSF